MNARDLQSPFHASLLACEGADACNIKNAAILVFLSAILGNAELRRLQLRELDFSHQNFDRLRLLECNLTRVCLADCNLSEGFFHHCHFVKCDFRECCVQESLFSDCIFDRCFLNADFLNSAQFQSCVWLGHETAKSSKGRKKSSSLSRSYPPPEPPKIKSKSQKIAASHKQLVSTFRPLTVENGFSYFNQKLNGI
jgi:hypothetical protein